ncbi:hypothetical protein ACLI4Z_02160 [Natrialbaceae archaeon A-arb3/5]
MSSVNEEKLTVTADIDDDLVVAVESIAVDVLVRTFVPVLDEFTLGLVAIVSDVLVELINSSARLANVLFARTASPDDVPAFGLLEDVLNKLDIVPIVAVLETISERLDDREVLDALVASVPVTALNFPEILPLEAPRIRTATGDVGDLGRIDANDFEGISDGGV